MKKLTRLLALLLALAMLFSLAACQERPEQPSTTEGRANVTEGAHEDEPAKTEAPATEAPATEAPATEAPRTEAPATEAPETDAPETEAPATDAPETQAPETDAPETEASETEALVTWPDDAPLFGRYEGEVDLNLMMDLSGETADDEEAQLYARLFEGCDNLVMYMEFSTGSRIRVGMDKASIDRMMDTMLQNMPKILPELMGMSMEELEEALASEGMSMDDFMAMMAENMNTDEFLNTEETNKSGTYRLDGDRLYVIDEDGEEDPDNYMVIELKDDSFTIVEVAGVENNEFSGLLPWTFHKTSDEPTLLEEPEPTEPTGLPEDLGSAVGTYRLTRAITAGAEMDPAALGLEMVFVLEEGGTGTAKSVIEADKDETELIWEQDGSKVLLTIDDEEQEAVFDGAALRLTIEDGTVELILERD